MIKIISNLVPGKDTDYLEHKEFEYEINRFIYENPGYELKEIKIVGSEFVAVLVLEKNLYHIGTLQKPFAKYDNVHELLSNLESVITNYKEKL